MEKRRVLKKGRIVITRQGSFVRELARKVVREIKPYSSKIEIAGSIRRKSKNPVDIDIVLIPKNKQKIKEIMSKHGKFLFGGEHKSGFKIRGVKVELYYTTPAEFGATLLAYSSETGAGIGLRVVAKKKGFKLNQYGLWKGRKKIASKTEKEIYKALGRAWKKPENR